MAEGVFRVSRLTGQPEAEAADALREAAEAAGAAPLLYLTATSSVLRGDPEDTARLLAQAVEDGGYQGLFLDVEKLQSGQKKEYTELAAAVRQALGDKTLYLMADPGGSL